VYSVLRLVEHGAGVSILPRSLKGHFPYLKINYIDLPDITETTDWYWLSAQTKMMLLPGLHKDSLNYLII